MNSITYSQPKIPNNLYEIYFSGGHTLLRVYNHVYYRAGQKGQCFESQPQIAKACGYAVKTIRKAIQQLVRDGLLKREKSDRKTFSYRVVNLLDPENLKAILEKIRPGKSSIPTQKQVAKDTESQKIFASKHRENQTERYKKTNSV